MVKYIGIFGQKEHGKSTAAKVLAHHACILRTSFAGKIKEIVRQVYGFTYEEIEYWKQTDEKPPGWKITMRQALQQIGTECFRGICDTTWTDYIFRQHKDQDSPVVFVSIDDGRFESEALEIKKRRGMNIIIFRPEKLNDDIHGSETYMRKLYRDIDYQGSVNGGLATVPGGYRHLFDGVILNAGSQSHFEGKIVLYVNEIYKFFRNQK